MRDVGWLGLEAASLVVRTILVVSEATMVLIFSNYCSIQKEYNTAYVYCKFNQLWNSVSSLFQPGSEDAQGRMITRIVSAMGGDWWYHTNCIVDGFLGDNYYDVGYCIGKLSTVVFDVTIG